MKGVNSEGEIGLVDGVVPKDVDTIILCTGYTYDYSLIPGANGCHPKHRIRDHCISYIKASPLPRVPPPPSPSSASPVTLPPKYPSTTLLPWPSHKFGKRLPPPFPRKHGSRSRRLANTAPPTRLERPPHLFYQVDEK